MLCFSVQVGLYNNFYFLGIILLLGLLGITINCLLDVHFKYYLGFIKKYNNVKKWIWLHFLIFFFWGGGEGGGHENCFIRSRGNQ